MEALKKALWLAAWHGMGDLGERESGGMSGLLKAAQGLLGWARKSIFRGSPLPAAPALRAPCRLAP